MIELLKTIYKKIERFINYDKASDFTILKSLTMLRILNNFIDSHLLPNLTLDDPSSIILTVILNELQFHFVEYINRIDKEIMLTNLVKDAEKIAEKISILLSSQNISNSEKNVYESLLVQYYYVNSIIWEDYTDIIIVLVDILYKNISDFYELQSTDRLIYSLYIILLYKSFLNFIGNDIQDDKDIDISKYYLKQRIILIDEVKNIVNNILLINENNTINNHISEYKKAVFDIIDYMFENEFIGPSISLELSYNEFLSHQVRIIQIITYPFITPFYISNADYL